MWHRRKYHRGDDDDFANLSTLTSNVEVEMDGPSSPPPAFGYVRYVDVQALPSMRDGSPETPSEQTVMIDDKFVARLHKWVGPVESRQATVRAAEMDLDDPDFPEDLKPRLAEALEGWHRLESEHAEFFRTLAVLAPGDRTFDYF